MRKEENAGYQHILLFPQGSQKVFPPGHQKLSLCDEQLTLYQTSKFYICPNSRHLWSTK